MLFKNKKCPACKNNSFSDNICDFCSFDISNHKKDTLTAYGCIFVYPILIIFLAATSGYDCLGFLGIAVAFCCPFIGFYELYKVKLNKEFHIKNFNARHQEAVNNVNVSSNL